MSAALHTASVNRVPLHPAGQPLSTEELRQRACTELLRQAAIEVGLLDAADPAPDDGLAQQFGAGALTQLFGAQRLPRWVQGHAVDAGGVQGGTHRSTGPMFFAAGASTGGVAGRVGAGVAPREP